LEERGEKRGDIEVEKNPSFWERATKANPSTMAFSSEAEIEEFSFVEGLEQLKKVKEKEEKTITRESKDIKGDLPNFSLLFLSLQFCIMPP
jgi:hypothetical protein